MANVVERLAAALVPHLTAAISGVAGTDGALVQVRPEAMTLAGDPPFMVQVTAGPERLVPATGEPDWAWFGYYPVRATAMCRVGSPSAPNPLPFMGEVRGVLLRAMLDFHPLATAVPELDDVESAAELERGWVQPQRAGTDFVVAGVRYRTREPA